VEASLIGFGVSPPLASGFKEDPLARQSNRGRARRPFRTVRWLAPNRDRERDPAWSPAVSAVRGQGLRRCPKRSWSCCPSPSETRP